jgi:hypothetical protein
MEVDPLVVVVPQGRGHIRSRSPLKDRREKPMPDKVSDRTKGLHIPVLISLFIPTANGVRFEPRGGRLTCASNPQR